MGRNEISDIDKVEYLKCLQNLCDEIDRQRLKTVMQLNASTLQHYWWLGNDILKKQEAQGWGAKVIDMLSADLLTRYGSDSGYSIRNLQYMRQFAGEYPDFPFVQVPLAQLQDISFESFEYEDPEPQGISRVFLTHPELNASAVARRVGISQSLMAQYINGTKKPSRERESLIMNEVKAIGREVVEM